MGSCIAVGTFDGVHLGHKAVFDVVASESRSRGMEPVAITFDTHPLNLVKPTDAPKILTELADKVSLIKGMGISRVEILHFDQGFSEMTPEAFVRHLISEFGCRVLVMGYDNAFGKGRIGTPSYMKGLSADLGFDLVEVGPVSLGGSIVSSTGIRSMISTGGIQEANRMLGWNYRLNGRVITGDGRGKKLGMATANLAVDPYMVVPSDGVYATLSYVNGVGFPSVTNIGLRPTFYGDSKDAVRTIEIHMLDFDGDLYDERLSLEFVGYLRCERRFGSVAELLDQVHADINSAKQMLSNV